MSCHSPSFDSPLGPLQLICSQQGVIGLLLPDQQPRMILPPPPAVDCPTSVTAVRQWLEAYFNGSQQAPPTTLFPEGTPFQQRVWQGLRQIPYGTTWSYAALALHIGAPGAVRAVGAAVGRNPLPIVIPCHRVVGSNGHLTGFSGGMDAKRRLLSLEGIALHPAKDRLAPAHTKRRHSTSG